MKLDVEIGYHRKFKETAPEVVRVHERLESHTQVRIRARLGQERGHTPPHATLLDYDISRGPGFRQMFLRKQCPTDDKIA